MPCAANVVQYTLRNGIRIYAYENFASPAVVVNGYLVAGALDEPRDKLGLAGFVADCLTRGTQRYSYEQIFELTEAVGANLSVYGGMYNTGFFTKSLAEDLPLLLDLLSEVLRCPTFPEAEVEKERAEWLTDLQERSNSTRAMAGLAFHELCYPDDHPYHYSTGGYPDTANAIALSDVVNFHHGYYAPADMVFTVVGAVKAEEARNRIGLHFEDWTASRSQRLSNSLSMPRVAGQPRRHVSMPEKSQSNLALGFPGPSTLDPEWLPCVMMNSILGQFGMYGRLGESVRKEEGLVYYIGSRFEGGLGPGPWSIHAGTNPNTVDRVIEIALSEMRRIREKKVKPGELADNKSYFIGSLPLHMETNEGIAGQILGMVRYERGLDYLLEYPDRVNAITADDIRAMAQKWLDIDNFVLVTAGA